MRHSVRALISASALVLGLGAAGAAGAAPAAPNPGASTPSTTTAAAASSPAVAAAKAGAVRKASTIKLSVGQGTGPQRTYQVTLLDQDGKPIEGADVDLGGLNTDPDYRVKTTVMTPLGVPGVYEATVSFPTDGDFAMQVRVGQPTPAAQLFAEHVTGTGAVATHDLAANPSKRAVLAIDPTFYQRYAGDSQQASGVVNADGTTTAATGGHGGATTAGSSTLVTHDTATAHHDFDALNVLYVMLHSLGALAWMVSVLGLVLANRLGAGPARTEITRFIGRHYTVLAGGGLLVVTFTGLQTALKASAGLNHPSQLLDTRLGTAYLAVFGLKMVLVVGSMITSWRLGRLLPTPARLLNGPRLASLGAMANEDTKPAIYRLAEANASFGALIIGCVVVLGQLHHAL
jgi:hypothetical protein